MPGSTLQIYVDAVCQICMETKRPFILLQCGHGLCTDCFRHLNEEGLQTAQMLEDPMMPGLQNDEGFAVFRGRWERAHFYCGRKLGRARIPGSDGRCGPNFGPQCGSCQRFQGIQDAADVNYASMETFKGRHGRNDEGFEVFPGRNENVYCGRKLGRTAIPGSGRCGPDTGPQCDSCKRFQTGSPGPGPS